MFKIKKIKKVKGDYEVQWEHSTPLDILSSMKIEFPRVYTLEKYDMITYDKYHGVEFIVKDIINENTIVIHPTKIKDELDNYMKKDIILFKIIKE